MGKRRYWLLKTEPGDWSWEDQRRSAGGVAPWDGVRNRQAQNHMKKMEKGDRCFFYHSGASDRLVVGVVEVVRPWYAGAGDGDGEGAVDVRAVGEMRRPVGLHEIKKAAEEEDGEAVKDFALLRQPRLSVVPVPEEIWDRICEMGGGYGDESAAERGGNTAPAEEGKAADEGGKRRKKAAPAEAEKAAADKGRRRRNKAAEEQGDTTPAKAEKAAADKGGRQRKKARV